MHDALSVEIRLRAERYGRLAASAEALRPAQNGDYGAGRSLVIADTERTLSARATGGLIDGSSQPSSQPKSAKLAAEAVIIRGQRWTSVDRSGESKLSTIRCWAPRFGRICFARRKTLSSIFSVRRPVKVFCWLTW